jgi:hypothetical protein
VAEAGADGCDLRAVAGAKDSMQPVRRIGCVDVLARICVPTSLESAIGHDTMIARAAAPILHRPRFRTIARAVPVALALGCSAPPGTGEDDDLPEFQGTLGAPGPGAPATATPGTGTPSSVPPASSNAPATGAGGSSGSEQVGAGAPLTPPSGASSGQPSGAGGSAMVPPASGPNAGAAGNSMGSGTATGAGGAGMGPIEEDPDDDEPVPPPVTPPPVNPVPNANCAGQFFCDDFEGVADGASPTAALWTIIDGYSERPASANVQVSADNARSGGQALRVANTNSRAGVRGRLPQTRYFVRAWFQIDSAPVGPVFIGLGTDQNSEARLRIQGQSFATINTVGPGDKVHPDAANSGNCPDCVTLTPNNWFCAEMFIDNAAQNATLWIDDVEAATLVNGDGGWPVQPANPALFLGSMSVQGGQTGVWIDDVVAGPNRIGCD